MERKLISVLGIVALFSGILGVIGLILLDDTPTPNQRLREIQKVKQEQATGESRIPHRVLASADTISQGDLVLYDHCVGGFGDGGEYLLVTSVNADDETVTGLHTSGEIKTASIARIEWVYNIVGSNTDNFAYASSEFLKKLAESAK